MYCTGEASLCLFLEVISRIPRVQFVHKVSCVVIPLWNFGSVHSTERKARCDGNTEDKLLGISDKKNLKRFYFKIYIGQSIGDTSNHSVTSYGPVRQ